jgi:ectoine hydroxylase-related dioxygenase (phytanoyl-CoA dioxygenase family)
MRVPDHHVEEFFRLGYTIVPDFLGADELAAAQEALWRIYPRPERFFADPSAYPELTAGPFAGLHTIPFSQYALNRLALHDDIAEVARRILDTDDVRLYKGEVWAKYAGEVDYEQHHHRDYGNHMLVVPRADGFGRQLNTYLYLCDVTEANGATAIVAVEHTRRIRMGVRRLAPGVGQEVEHKLCGPAGSLVLYSADVFHRGTRLSSPDAARFMMLCDYRRADTPWVSKQAFGHHGNKLEMEELVIRSTPAQRTLLDIPAPGHPYWDTQTLDDMELRYPGIDTEPYRRQLA